MRDATLKKRLNLKLDKCGYDFSKFRLDEFTRWVSDWRGRPIQIVPMNLPPGLFGAWMEGPTMDFVFYDDEPPQTHVTHIILHELSHILLGHRTAHIGNVISDYLQSNDSAGANAPELVSGLLRTVKHSEHSDEQEIEAETFSALIQHRVIRQAGISALEHQGSAEGMRQFVR